jgi:hypothetical protein
MTYLSDLGDPVLFLRAWLGSAIMWGLFFAGMLFGPLLLDQVSLLLEKLRGLFRRLF